VQQRHQVSHGTSLPGREPVAAQRGELLQQCVRLALSVRVTDGERLGVPSRESWGDPILFGDLSFHPPDGRFPLYHWVGIHAAGEPLVVDDLQQGGERPECQS
jgi:hypothetical protein